MRCYVGAVHTLNNALEQLPPSFDATQKILDQDMMDILASNAPKKHKELMTDQGFDPQLLQQTDSSKSANVLKARKQPFEPKTTGIAPMTTLPKKNARARSPTRKGQPSPTRTKELHTYAENMVQTPLATARTVKFYPEIPLTGRRRTLSKSLSTKTSTKRKHANSTFFKRKRVKRKRNGPRPTTS
jgi:hypothetical protein